MKCFEKQFGFFESKFHNARIEAAQKPAIPAQATTRASDEGGFQERPIRATSGEGAIEVGDKKGGMPRLENWFVIGTGDAYTAPEAQGRVLVGIVYGHPKHDDGKQIRTSRLQTLDLKTRVAVTRNTTYTLGMPDADYAKQFPASLPATKVACPSCGHPSHFPLRCGFLISDSREEYGQLRCECLEAATKVAEGNETKPVSDLLESMKVVDRSQRYIECRSDVLIALMYELARHREGSPIDCCRGMAPAHECYINCGGTKANPSPAVDAGEPLPPIAQPFRIESEPRAGRVVWEADYTLLRLAAENSIRALEQRLADSDKTLAIQQEATKSAEAKLKRERSVWCDQPEDRLYHASDRTWWKRVGVDCTLADAPPIVAELSSQIAALTAAMKEIAGILEGPIMGASPNHYRKVALVKLRAALAAGKGDANAPSGSKA